MATAFPIALELQVRDVVLVDGHRVRVDGLAGGLREGEIRVFGTYVGEDHRSEGDEYSQSIACSRVLPLIVRPTAEEIADQMAYELGQLLEELAGV